MGRSQWVVGLLAMYFLLIGSSVSAAAQQNGFRRELDVASGPFQGGSLDEAVLALRAEIAELSTMEDSQGDRVRLANAHLRLGLLYLAMRDESLALENFRQVARLDPQRTLDPEIYSWKAVRLFEQARSQVMDRGGELPAEPAIEDDQAQAALTAPPPSSTGNLWTQIQPGTKVRLQFRESNSIVGTLLVSSDRTLTVVAGANQNLSFHRDSVTKVEVMTGRKGHWLMGAIVGAAMGALIGAAETPGCGGRDGDCYTRGENIGYGSLGFGMFGALIGALCKTDQWVEVPANRVVHADAIKNPGIAVSFTRR